MSFVDDLFFRRRPTLPVYMSSELAECSLACLAMIGAYHGHDIDLNTLRQRFSISVTGANLRGVMRLADSIGLSTRALRVEVGALQHVVLPAILHWNMNHFVVLKSISDSGISIHDPARGEVKLTMAEVSNHFTGVVLELSPAAHFEKISGRRQFRLSELFSNIRGHWSSLGYVLLLSVALQMLAFILPFQMQLVVDKAIDGSDSGLLLVICVAFGGLAVLGTVITGLRDWTLLLLSSQFVYQVAGNIFRHLLRLSAGFFEKRHLGDILSRLGSIKQIQDLITHGMLSAIVDGTMVLVSGIALLIYSPAMAGVVFGTVLLCAVITVASYPMIRTRSERSITAIAKEQSYLMESIRGVVAVKLMGAESVRESNWRNLYARAFNESLSLNRVNQSIRIAENIILGLQFVIVVYMGASAVIQTQGLSVGMFLSFLAYRAMFTERTQALIQHGLQMGTLAVLVERLGDFVGEKQEVSPGEYATADATSAISLQNLSFRYGETDPFVLEGVNLDIRSGEYLAIVGPSGGGKTTLLKLLVGLQLPSVGRVMLNGEMATPAMWQAWRTQIGIVRQDDQLFSGTLAENIAFFDPEMDMFKVIDAAKAAHIHDDINSLPTKYLTPIGDMGSSLSGGQRQRILLARALYRSPKILILDEGTANLDPATENVLVDLVANMDITRIVVAHRPALVERAQRVVMVEGRKIVEVR